MLARCAGGWTSIPAENLVAAHKACASGAQVYVTATSAALAAASFGALEAGVDGVLLETDSPVEAVAAAEAAEAARADAVPREPIVHFRVTAVRPIGMGDRACVDLCELCAPGEGLLVGSFSRALALVHNEGIECGYVAARPFRINAGPVSSYVAAPHGKTAYLAELRAGDEVLLINTEGRARTATIARVKVERRPLTLVEAEEDSPEAGQPPRRLAVALQSAETVRVCTPEGEGVRAVTELAVGDVLLGRVDGKARHTGLAIDEARYEER